MRLPLVRVAIAGGVEISLGRSQRGTAVEGQPARSRSSGGGAVLVGPWLLRALVVVPRSHPALDGGPARAALWLGRLHQQWLASLDIHAELYQGRLIDHWACFAGRAPGELVLDGRKLTGISQTWRRRRALLWSGTLIDAVPWELLAGALGRGAGAADELARTTANARALLRPGAAQPDWAGTLRRTLAAACGA